MSAGGSFLVMKYILLKEASKLNIFAQERVDVKSKKLRPYKMSNLKPETMPNLSSSSIVMKQQAK